MFCAAIHFFIMLCHVCSDSTPDSKNMLRYFSQCLAVSVTWSKCSVQQRRPKKGARTHLTGEHVEGCMRIATEAALSASVMTCSVKGDDCVTHEYFYSSRLRLINSIFIYPHLQICGSWFDKKGECVPRSGKGWEPLDWSCSMAGLE
jgi:hypothetical protein